MSKDKETSVKVTKISKGAPFSGMYFLIFIAAAVYYIQHTSGFWNIVVAFLKACVWPAMVSYHVFQLIKL